MEGVRSEHEERRESGRLLRVYGEFGADVIDAPCVCWLFGIQRIFLYYYY